MMQAGSPEMLKNYELMRKTGMNLNNQIMKSIIKKDLEKAAKTLGLSDDGTLVFNDEDEMAILFDYCIHYSYKDNCNALKRFFFSMQPKLSDLEVHLLTRKINANFCIFEVCEALSHGAMLVMDIFNEDKFILMDKSLSSFSKGILDGSTLLVFGSTLIKFEGFTMTTGTPILINRDLFKKITPYLESFMKKYAHFDNAPKEIQGEFVIQFLKAAMSTGATSQTRYSI